MYLNYKDMQLIPTDEYSWVVIAQRSNLEVAWLLLSMHIITACIVYIDTEM